MVIRFKKHTITRAHAGLNKWDLHRDHTKKNGKVVSKEVAYGMNLEYIVQTIIQETLDEVDSEVTLEDFLLEYIKLSTLFIAEIKKLESKL
jgi:hypothetical protein